MYQHVGSPKDSKYVERRRAIAAQFLQNYGSDIGDGGNANPYFVGMFDTVSAIASYSALAVTAAATVALFAAISWGLSTYLGLLSVIGWFGIFCLVVLIAMTAWYVKAISNLPEA